MSHVLKMTPRCAVIGLIGLLPGFATGGLAATGAELFNSDLPEVSQSAGPDGVYVTRTDGPWGSDSRSSILFGAGDDGALQAPVFARDDADEGDFYYAPALQQACFTSDRAARGNPDIWCVHWKGGRWAEPVRLPPPVNSEGREYSPVLAEGGTLYFASDRAGQSKLSPARGGLAIPGLGQGDIYRAARVPGSGWQVEALPAAINSTNGEWNLELTSDAQGLLFEASGRATNRTVPGDLYFSRRESGQWSAAVPLSRLNSDGSDLMPRFQPDGTLLYSRSEGPGANIVRAAAGAWEPIEPVVIAVARSAGEVVLLEPDTLEIRTRLAVGPGPHDIASSEDGRLTIAASYGVFPTPHDEPVEPDSANWVSRISDGLRLLDLGTGAERARAGLHDCARPHGLAATAQAQRFWVTCEEEGSVREFSGDDYRELRRFELGKGVHKVMYLSARSMLVASNPEAGAIDLIDLESGSVKRLRTGGGAEGLAATGDGSRVFVTNAFQQDVCAVDVARAELIACWPSGGEFPIAVAHDARRDWLWILNNASSILVALDAGTGEIQTSVSLGSQPLGLAFDARGDRLLIGLPRRNEVIAVSASSGEIVARSERVMEVDDIDLVPAAYFGSSPDT